MSRAKKLGLVLFDVALLYAALALTLLLRYPVEDFLLRFEHHFMPFSLVFVIWLLVFYLADLYRHTSFANLKNLTHNLGVGIAIAGVVSITLFYLFGEFFELTPKRNLVVFGVLFTALDYSLRALFVWRRKERGTAALIVGTSPRIKEVVDHLAANPHIGYRVARHIEHPDDKELTRLSEHVKETRAQFLVVEPGLTKHPHVIDTLYRLLPLETSLVSFPDFYELVFEKVPLDELEEGWFVERIVTHRPLYDNVKRITDFLLALILFIFLIPLSLLIALLVRITSQGPVLYREQRAGKHGIPFTLCKFRSMRMPDGEERWELWTERNDSRVTSFGTFLRFTHLDEIPQLWNIVKGDISFAGPRPERVELAEKFRALPHYEIRHVVKPGLTGWAQINYRPSASLDEAEEKLKYDIYYVEHRSFLLDFLILIRTVRYIFASHR